MSASFHDYRVWSSKLTLNYAIITLFNPSRLLKKKIQWKKLGAVLLLDTDSPPLETRSWALSTARGCPGGSLSLRILRTALRGERAGGPLAVRTLRSALGGRGACAVPRRRP